MEDELLELLKSKLRVKVMTYTDGYDQSAVRVILLLDDEVISVDEDWIPE